MFKKQIKTKHLMGFAAESAKEGVDKKIKVWIRGSFNSSDPVFSIYMNQISSLFLLRARINPNFVNKCLIILHKNNFADIYVNDFSEMLEVKVNKNIKKGEKVFRKDITDIRKIKFPDIKILKDDAVMYFAKINWKYCLYFDFTRKVDQERIQTEIGKLINNLHSQIQSNNLSVDNRYFVDKNKEKVCRDKIFTEGITDKMYLEKFKEFFIPDLSFDIIDIQDSYSSGGAKKLLNHFYTMVKSGHFGYKCFFVFDCDARDDFKECEKIKTEFLIPFCWNYNELNKIQKNGIENLFEENLFKEGSEKKKRFFPIITKDYGDKKVNVPKREFDKEKFAKFICEERNDIDDFKNFQQLTKSIK